MYRVHSRVTCTLFTLTLLSACAAPSERQQDSPSAAAAPSTAAPSTASSAVPFPPGFDYPAGPALEAAIAAGDVARLRQHGWWLWAGLNTALPDGTPLWWSWPNSTQAYANPDPSPVVPARSASGSARHDALHMIAANLANTPINLPAPYYPVPTVDGDACQTGTSTDLPDGARFQANGDVMIAGVVYNDAAFQWLRSQRLYQARTLTAQWQPVQDPPKQIAAFPDTSIVLKHMYWPAKGDDFTALPVWDPTQFPQDDPDYVGYERWKRIVVIDPSGKPVLPGMTGVARYLHHVFESDQKTPLGPFLKTGRLVSVNDFYHHRVSAAELAALDANDRRILDASACWLYDRPFRAGDLLVSVAMHIITREIDRWAMQSVWWHDRPDVGPFAADRPAIPPSKAPGPWAHYLMTIEYGLEASPGMLPVSYNPFIELAAAHPIVTNCRNCHLRAAWPSGFNTHAPKATVTASYEANGGPGPLADLSPEDPVFNQLLLLDFQWAISDRAN